MSDEEHNPATLTPNSDVEERIGVSRNTGTKRLGAFLDEPGAHTFLPTKSRVGIVDLSKKTGTLVQQARDGRDGKDEYPHWEFGDSNADHVIRIYERFWDGREDERRKLNSGNSKERSVQT